MSPRSALLAAATAATVLVSAAPAHAQGTANGQFGIAPARRDVVGRPPADLVPTRVSNSTQAAFDVTVFPVLLSQGLQGDFLFSEQPRPLNQARTILTVTPDKFHLNPGDSQMVRLHWNLLPNGAHAAYVGVVFSGVPVVNGKRNVNVTDRLLSINFLRLPGHYTSSGRFDGMHVTQAPVPRILRFLPRVRNTGQVVDSPTHTSLVVESASGQHLYKERWPGDVVLPGVTREFIIDVRHVFQAGDYVAVATMDFGSSRHQVVKQSFRLTGPNTLPSGAIAVNGFGANGQIGQPAHLTATVSNPGTAPASTTVRLQLYHITGAASDTRPVAQTSVPFTNLAPKTKRPLDVQLGKTEAGHYRAVLTYRDSTNGLRSLSAEFDATKERSFWDRFKHWWSSHGVLVVVILALLLLASVVARFRRRQRRLEQALAERSAASQAPAAAAPVGAVNLNSASVEELQRLPGVGPKAAQRIVDHRDEYGPFRSVEELAEVSGFGPARIEELRELVSV